MRMLRVPHRFMALAMAPTRLARLTPHPDCPKATEVERAKMILMVVHAESRFEFHVFLR